jgi:ATP-dependent 26S proteasome regulatory subunit
MTNIAVQIAKSINEEYGSHNVAYYKSFANINLPQLFIVFKVTNFCKLVYHLSLPELKENHIYLNNRDRMTLYKAIGETTEIQMIDRPKTVHTISMSILDKNKKLLTHVPNQMFNTIKKTITDTVVNRKTLIHFMFNDTNIHSDRQRCAAVLNNMFYANIIDVFDSDHNDMPYGVVDASTEIIIVNNENNSCQINLSSIDFEKIGIGGLNTQVTELVKSIFMTRIIPEKIYNKLGIKHTKGVILYGPPGCGKTRLARQMGALIGCNNIKIINGPELINKYVGESERNIRECFDEAKKKKNELHLLIFDEFDALSAKRSDSQNGNNEKIVSQLLTMLDGIDEINNLIVFALTNRLDMIDPAILRHGRFGIHIKIDLPNQTGRHEILNIHSTALRQNKLLTDDVDLMKIADITENYTGAELECLVQTTLQNVLGAQVDFKNIAESAKKIENIKVGQNDFIVATEKIIPMFKSKSSLSHELSSKIKKLPTNNISNEVIDYIKARDYPVVCCIEGIPRSGKTSIVCDIALRANVGQVEYLCASVLCDLTDHTKIDYLTDIFSKSCKTLIILDNIEMILEFVSELIFNKSLLHTLKILLNETIHPVIITTSYAKQLTRMTVLDSVEQSFNLN